MHHKIVEFQAALPLDHHLCIAMEYCDQGAAPQPPPLPPPPPRPDPSRLLVAAALELCRLPSRQAHLPPQAQPPTPQATCWST
jgi:hypothetical protein